MKYDDFKAEGSEAAVKVFIVNHSTIYFSINKVMLHIFIEHAWNGRIFIYGLKSDVTIVFLDLDFLTDAEILAICIHLRPI